MTTLYKGKYRSDTCRLRNWDYGWNGDYFVTIGTKNRIHWFGEVQNGEMKLSEMGKIARRCWLEIPDHFPFVKLGEHIIMPDHVHGIVTINKSIHDKRNAMSQNITTPHFVPQKQFGPQSQNLPSIIRGFKIGVTKNARLINKCFRWQPRYYVHIIRNKRAIIRISRYIVDNPANWGKKK
jgi:REP element-mobilizing transposase RayT